MEIKLTESQFANIIKRILKEQTEEVLELPHIKYFFDDWNEVIKYVKEQGNPLFSMQGNLDFQDVCPETLGGLYSVEGYLDLYYCYNLTSLGDLSHVGEWLDLRHTKIISLGDLSHVGRFLNLDDCENLTSLGNLKHVGGDLYLSNTPIAKKYSKEEIRKMVNVKGNIYL